VLGHWTMPSLIRALALEFFVMVFSLSVHECAHAWVAFRLGDDTAAREGRLSLSPVTHVDLWGTLIIPAVGLVLGGIGFIGWAKPTPVSPHRFTRRVSMGTGEVLVSVAGPLSNLLLACLSLGLIAVLARGGVHIAAARGGVGTLLVTMFELNVGLAVFNLLPFPPLDGSRLLPRSTDRLQAKIAPYSFFLLILILNVPILCHWLLVVPVQSVARALQMLFQTPISAGLGL
jgi:Zn-dependent protease